MQKYPPPPEINKTPTWGSSEHHHLQMCQKSGGYVNFLEGKYQTKTFKHFPCLGAEAEPAVLRSWNRSISWFLEHPQPFFFSQRGSRTLLLMFSIDTGQMATRNSAVENLRLVVEPQYFTWFHQPYYYIIWICFSNIFSQTSNKNPL